MDSHLANDVIPAKAGMKIKMKRPNGEESPNKPLDSGSEAGMTQE
jgi:hypothetical protein